MAALAGALMTSLLSFTQAPGSSRSPTLARPTASADLVQDGAGNPAPALAVPEQVKARLASAVSWGVPAEGAVREEAAASPRIAPNSLSLARAEGRSAAFLRAAPEFEEEPPAAVEPEAAARVAAVSENPPGRYGGAPQAVWSYKGGGRSGLMGRSGGPVRNVMGRSAGGAMPAGASDQPATAEMIEQLKARVLVDPSLSSKARARILERLDVLAALAVQPQ